MKNISIVIIFVFVGIVVSSCADSAEPQPRAPQQSAPEQNKQPTGQQLSAARQEMSEWAEGRWQSYTVQWDGNGNKVVMTALASAGANQVAVNGYCKILKDIAREYFSGFNVAGGVSAGGEITICQ